MLEEVRIAEPVRFMAPGTVVVDMPGLLARPGATFFSSSYFAAVDVLPIVVLAVVEAAPTPGRADIRPVPLADILPAVEAAVVLCLVSPGLALVTVPCLIALYFAISSFLAASSCCLAD